MIVGPGISPGQLPLRLRALAGFTAGGGFHPALKARFGIVRVFIDSHLVTRCATGDLLRSIQSTEPLAEAQLHVHVGPVSEMRSDSAYKGTLQLLT
jgi:hypothetical protein